jgi:heptosyltransferase-2
MFRFHLSTLPTPFRGADSYHRPLILWGLKSSVPAGPQFFSRAALPQDVLSKIGELRRPLIALAPAAAWKMKRWPVAHWKALVTEMPEAGFILLGGAEDRFVSEIADVAPDRCLNLAGRLKLSETSGVLGMSDLVIANDTGLLHVADQMERPTLALIGPTAFGYPSHATSEALELNLDCKPCSKDGSGGCKNEIYQRCLVDLKPGYVVQKARERLNTGLPS